MYAGPSLDSIAWFVYNRAVDGRAWELLKPDSHDLVHGPPFGALDSFFLWAL